MINYVVREKHNPQLPEEPRKFYGMAKSLGVVNIREIAEQISLETSLGTSDVLAVLESLLINIPKNLRKGFIVKLRDFGTFKLMMSTEGSSTSEEFQTSMIKKTKIHFKPDPLFSNALSSLEFRKVT